MKRKMSAHSKKSRRGAVRAVDSRAPRGISDIELITLFCGPTVPYSSAKGAMTGPTRSRLCDCRGR